MISLSILTQLMPSETLVTKLGMALIHQLM
jgi:hypothetical protein